MYKFFNIDNWSYLKQIMVNLMFGILILMLGYEAKIKPLQNRLQHKQNEILAIKKNIANQKQELTQQNSPLPTQLITKATMLNSDLEIANILSALEQAILQSQVEPCIFEPLLVRESEWLLVYPIQLELNGQYKNFLMFLDSVMKQTYLIVAEEMVLQKNITNGNENLTMKILLNVYKNKKDLPHEISPRIPRILIPERDIFQQLKKRASLYLWANHELRFLGLVKQASNTFGVVSDPMGEIYRVVVGDKIGLNQSVITAINEKGITATNPADSIVVGSSNTSVTPARAER